MHLSCTDMVTAPRIVIQVSQDHRGRGVFRGPKYDHKIIEQPLRQIGIYSCHLAHAVTQAEAWAVQYRQSLKFFTRTSSNSAELKAKIVAILKLTYENCEVLHSTRFNTPHIDREYFTFFTSEQVAEVWCTLITMIQYADQYKCINAFIYLCIMHKWTETGHISISPFIFLWNYTPIPF